MLDKELNKKIIIAKSSLSTYGKKKDLEITSEFKGSTLKGIQYEPLFTYFADLQKEGAFRIHNDDYVTTDNGTGIVHLAPSFGEDDNRVMRQADVNLEVCPINEKGEFTRRSF